MDLLTFLRLGKRLLRLVTVFFFFTLANVYYNNEGDLYFEKKNGGYCFPNWVRIMASVIKPTRPMILSASISIGQSQ